MTAANDIFSTLDSYNAIPRVSSLVLSPDGRRLVGVVEELAENGKSRTKALWEIDPAGQRPAIRLTRSAEGESSPVFAQDGSLLFLSTRSAASGKDDEKLSGLWSLPETGEATRIYAPAGGVSSIKVAQSADVVVVETSAFPGNTVGEQDHNVRKARKDAGVTAILHESYPIRDWDHDHGPDRARLVSASLPQNGDNRIVDVVELSPDHSGRVKSDYALSRDGQLIAYGYQKPVSAEYGSRDILKLVRVDGSEERVIADADGYSFGNPAFTPDSGFVICHRESESTAELAPQVTLVRISLDSGEIVELTPNFPTWPGAYVIAPDGSAVFFVADDHGRQPLWRLDLASGEIIRLTASGSYSDLCVSPDSSTIYALRNSIDQPPQPVRLNSHQSDQQPQMLLAPGAVTSLPGRLTEVETSVEDGRVVRAWLALPHSAADDQPAPLLLWIHGGPVMSWAGWSWRWNPWLAVAQGYAVLMPDPALSTGYGQDFIQAGWGAWGSAPFTDLMAITDVARARPDIDAERIAAMGGSFGGYMANWIATQTDRFKAIVSHASLWNLEAFTGTTDASYYWIREMGDPLQDTQRIYDNSPHLRVANIRTPMLVIHGDKDYRVPLGEGIRLYFDLVRHGVDAKFLYFPDENHWILSPGNAKIWYETIFAFLAEHVLDQGWKRPELL